MHISVPPLLLKRVPNTLYTITGSQRSRCTAVRHYEYICIVMWDAAKFGTPQLDCPFFLPNVIELNLECHVIEIT